ncbi:hypothetical protein FRC10_002828 [Ceratobasidium sp. 414]|nr:hypothetical protein FRC10_002828 [Ceratobasidium sp. 414]
MLGLHLSSLFVLAAGVLSAPSTERRILSGPVAALSTAEVDSYIPYCCQVKPVGVAVSDFLPFEFERELFAKRHVEGSCQADPVKDFVVYNSGGDGGKVQFYLNLVPLPVDTTRFPGVPLLALVHSGFKIAHGRTATVVLDTVRKVIEERGAKTVISVGHSLGGALALLEGLHMRLNLPPSINVITRTFGQPRVGSTP